ncbi:hypothetical protein [Emticicia sp. 21SJ11W-3]|uniref:hypothetical protein n=1 Tax=Emticicia sp. 21SJ11W-3 TaxID=2916755 RepID=UPI00209D6F52|nr:hypothetical protein [Emticicia sp. 21SJ11W-3]UTA69199.1 hypothetical protein MB380_05200 [Emticicia sp. 21SJ11W-3]
MNIRYLTATFLLLISELFFNKLPADEEVFWTATLRLIAAIVLVAWYYNLRRPLPTTIDRQFIATLILPVFISLCVIIYPDGLRIFNLVIHAGILILWTQIFKNMGAEIKTKDESYKLLRVIPVYALVPILFYIISLHPSLPFFEEILLLIYTAIYAYTATLASFLPIGGTNKFWISWCVVLMAFANILVFYNTYVEPLPWLSFIPRAIVMLSRCILIFGMVEYFKTKE